MHQQHPVLKQLQGVTGLPSPPQVAMQIVEVTRDPDKGLKDLADVLQLDPAISAKVLQISNSAAYARTREVVTLTDAINLLGTKSLSIIALGFSLKKAIPAVNDEGLSDLTLWKHSVAVGVASRAISRFLGTANGETAFVCGLLSRIGQLVFLAFLPDTYRPVLSNAEHVLPTSSEEQAILEITHHQVGRLLLDKWQLPPGICDVVEQWGDKSPRADRTEDTELLIGIVRVADAIRALVFDEDKATGLQDLHALANELCGMTEGEIDRLFVACQNELQDTLAVFTDDPHADISCESILSFAREQLVQVGLELATGLTAAEENAEKLTISNNELHERSSTDALTQLHNRFALDQELSALDGAQSSGKPKRAYSIIMLDVDHFKSFNDTYGHAAGDQVLQSIGAALFESARSTDFVARYGGEEFTVILPNCRHAEAAMVADRFRAAIQNRGIELADKTLFVTASLGVASSDSFAVGTSHHEILKCADTALYAAKKQGRNCVVQHDRQPQGT